jgi:hypothetical protein
MKLGAATASGSSFAAATGFDFATARGGFIAAAVVAMEELLEQATLEQATAWRARIASRSDFAATSGGSNFARRGDFAAASGLNFATASRCCIAAVVVVVEELLEQATLEQPAAGRARIASRSDFATTSGFDHFAATRRLTATGRSGIAAATTQHAAKQAKRAGFGRPGDCQERGHQNGGDETTHRSSPNTNAKHEAPRSTLPESRPALCCAHGTASIPPNGARPYARLHLSPLRESYRRLA